MSLTLALNASTIQIRPLKFRRSKPRRQEVEEDENFNKVYQNLDSRYRKKYDDEELDASRKFC